jgi:MFS family permease
MAVIFAIFAIGTSLGPFIGGAIVQNSSWRWIFWINLPIAGTSLILLVAFLHVSYDRTQSISHKLRRIDYIGNALLVASVTAVLLALTYGGTLHPWSSWRILLPLILGFVGLGAFYLYQLSTWCRDPMVPPHLLANRTSTAAFYLTFVHALFSFWIIYFLPIYFQGVLASNPIRSGVLLLPTVVTIVSGGLVSGLVLSKFGRYKPLHLAGFLMMAVGVGLFIMLDQDSGLALYLVFQIIAGLGSGLVVTTLLPAVQAPLSEKDTASSTALWSFIRGFGIIWGISVPAAIFNSSTSALSGQIDDTAIRALIANGAYSHAYMEFILTLTSTTRQEVISVFTDSLHLVWIALTAIVGASFFVVFVEKDIALRGDLQTDYGLDGAAEKTSQE